MKIIKLHLLNLNPVYINVNQIGHFFEVENENNGKNYTHSKIGITTHNNGGLNVIETVDQILKLINTQ